MVSLAADWPSGATGIACDADIAAKPSPRASTEAARIFIDVSFLVVTHEKLRIGLGKHCGKPLTTALTSNAGASSGGGASGGANPNAVCASPSDGDASPNGGGGASPSDAGASPNGGLARGPSALLRA